MRAGQGTRNHRTYRLGGAILAAMMGFAASPAAAAIPQSERDVLISLYAHTDGENWTHNDAWNGAAGTECAWYGITCDAAESHVTAVELPSNALAGTLPDITPLTELVTFDVSINSLTGPLPSIAGMHKLESFFVGFNWLDGELPALTDLDALTAYLVNDNRFTGQIPSFDRVPTLVTIGVGGNALTGSIPALAGLAQLDGFAANDNQLTGALPPLPQGGTLRYLIVNGNRLSGRLPPAPPGPGHAILCPNAFAPVPDAGWDALTGNSPWYVGCQGAAFNLDQFGAGGSWYDPSMPGQGLVLSVMPYVDAQGHGILFGGWFTFEPQTTGEPSPPHWFSIQGEVGIDSHATLDLYDTTGGSFDGTTAPTTQRIGTVSLYLEDCFHGLLVYHFDDGRVPDYPIYMARLTQSETCTLTGANPPPAHNALLSGAWYDPEHSGQGFVIDLAPSQHTLFGAWYTFAPDATNGDEPDQRWYSLQAAFSSPDAHTFDDVGIFEPQLGVFGEASTDPVLQVGSANLEFQSCDALTIDYAFDAPDSRAGTLQLVRLGPTPAGCE